MHTLLLPTITKTLTNLKFDNLMNYLKNTEIDEESLVAKGNQKPPQIPNSGNVGG